MSLSDRAKEELWLLSSQAETRAWNMTQSFSGADKVESTIYYAQSHAYRDMARGATFEEAVMKQAIEFRKFAVENDKKIADAPKLSHKFGYGGQSSLHYRWISHDAFERTVPHMRIMAERAMALGGPSLKTLPGSQPTAPTPVLPDASATRAMWKDMDRSNAAPAEAAPVKSASKLVAVSKDRYRASASEKRMYGGSTVTEFYIHRKEDAKDPSKWKVVRGYGPTPGERKTDAMRRSGL